MRASSSSTADEGKSTSIIAGLRYKVWQTIFGAMKKVKVGNIRDATGEGEGASFFFSCYCGHSHSFAHQSGDQSSGFQETRFKRSSCCCTSS
jgi:hypothetical protein